MEAKETHAAFKGAFSPCETCCQVRAAGCHRVIPPPSPSRPAALPTSSSSLGHFLPSSRLHKLPSASSSVTHLDRRQDPRLSGSQCGKGGLFVPGYPRVRERVCVCVRARAYVRRCVRAFPIHSSPPSPARCLFIARLSLLKARVALWVKRDAARGGPWWVRLTDGKR